MKILWITNTLFPAVCEKLGLPVPHVGGWMFSGAQQLLQKFDFVKLGVATLYEGKDIQAFNLEGISYFLLPRSVSYNQYDKKLEVFWKEVKEQFKPDVVHIHGSEYPHGVAYINGCGNENTVVSIQGLVSVYERYYFGGILRRILRKNTTVRDYVRKDTIFQQHKRMQKRAGFERELIQKTRHVIGRTSWDKAHTRAINPHAQYHFCNETLRNEFYKHSWNFEKAEKYSIFLSQAHYPIKGLHQVIKALPFILRDFPETKVYVAGNDFFSEIKKWKMNGFGSYIRGLIRKYNLEDIFTFTGILSEKEMCSRYLQSNVFVCPSSIENSPNSVGEAQLLGVPCVASYVGGTSDMVTHSESGLLYRFEEVEMLAENVRQIFKNTDFAMKLSQNEREVAKQRHNQDKNSETLYSIYKEICKK